MKLFLMGCVKDNIHQQKNIDIMTTSDLICCIGASLTSIEKNKDNPEKLAERIPNLKNAIDSYIDSNNTNFLLFQRGMSKLMKLNLTDSELNHEIKKLEEKYPC